METWECQFRKELNDNKDLKELVKSMNWVSPLDPRDAFYGGRTDMAKSYHKAEESEQIIYEISRVCTQQSTSMERIPQAIQLLQSTLGVKISTITLVQLK